MRLRLLHFSITLLPAILLSLLMAAGGCRNTSLDPSDAPLTIAVSYGAQAWLLDNIVGDRIKTVTLLPSGADPENFDPTIATLRQVADSRYYLTTSAPGFEQRLGQLIRENFRDVNILDITEGIDIISGTHNRVEIESEKSAHPHDAHEHGHLHDTDPHLFSSVANVRVLADNMLRLVCDIDTANAEYYRDNHSRLVNRLDSLDRALAEDVRQACGDKGSNTIIVMHPMMSYFARDYNIRQVALEESGKEASPRYLKESIDYARESQPFAFIIERGHMLPQMKEISRHLQIPILELSLNDYDWYSNMEQLGCRLKSK